MVLSFSILSNQTFDWPTMNHCLLTTLFISTIFLLVKSNTTPCIIWKNSFLEITPQSTKLNETILSITVKSLQTKGWIAVGFSKNQSSLEDSIFFLSQIQNQVFVLKNHTQQDFEEKIFDISTTQSISDIIDGIHSFRFKLNSSLVLEKNFIFFSMNNAPMGAVSNVSLLQKHSSFSSAYFLNLYDNNVDFPACPEHLNLPARILSYNIYLFILGILICVILCLFFVYYRNEQPLKSRFFAPIISVVFLALNLSVDYLNSGLTAEEHVSIKCKTSGFMTYPFVQIMLILPTLLMIRYSVLLQLHLFKKNFIQNWKSLKRKSSATIIPIQSVSDMTQSFSQRIQATTQQPTVVVIIQKLRQFLLILQSPFALIVTPFLWFALFELGMFGIFAISGFKCKSFTRSTMLLMHALGIFFTTFVFALFFALDIILSFRHFIKCRWKTYFLEEDPFHFRIDFMMLIFFVPTMIVWATVNLPNFFLGIFTDTLFYIGILMSGGLPLLITIGKSVIYQIKSKNVRSKRLGLNIEFIIKDENLLEKFIEFAELEWSSENVYFKIDLNEYKKKSDSKSKRNLAHQIKENYLIRNVSPLEINVSGKALNPTIKKIEDQEFTSNLFDLIDREVDVNLCDTLARFIISSQYDQYLKENEVVLTKLGL
jgi:hypothetical protein